MKTFIFVILLILVNGDDNEQNNNYEKQEPIARDIDIVERGILSDNRTNMSPRIVGGNAAVPGMFPSQAAVMIHLDNSSRFYFCGGVLIHPCFVLTAAHCCESAKKFQIVLGAINFRIWEPTQERFYSTEKIIHRNWNNETLKNDVCLIQLPWPVKNTDYIKPMQIWNKSKRDTLGQYATISGWGRTSDKNMYINDVLRYVSVPVIETCEGLCRNIYTPISKKNICTSSNNGMSPCNGDSGGPMMITQDDGTDLLVGIVSYGHVKGCQLGFPAVQTYVPCYKKWILKVINYYLPDDDDYECAGDCV